MVLGIRLDFIVVCFFLSENLINSLECAVNLLLAPHGALSTGMFHVFPLDHPLIANLLRLRSGRYCCNWRAHFLRLPIW